jgi:hypothetical protein
MNAISFSGRMGNLHSESSFRQAVQTHSAVAFG